MCFKAEHKDKGEQKVGLSKLLEGKIEGWGLGDKGRDILAHCCATDDPQSPKSQMAPGPTRRENQELFIGIVKTCWQMERKRSYVTICMYVMPLNCTLNNS